MRYMIKQFRRTIQKKYLIHHIHIHSYNSTPRAYTTLWSFCQIRIDKMHLFDSPHSLCHNRVLRKEEVVQGEEVTGPQWEDCKTCGGDHWTVDHPVDRPTTEAGRALLGLDLSPESDYWVNLGANEMRTAILAIEAEAKAAGRAEALGVLDTLPWAEILHDLDGTQHYITHETSYEGDDMEGVACITGPEGHAEDATDLLRAVLAALSDTAETKGDGFVTCPLCHDPELADDMMGGVCLTCADAIAFSQNARRGSVVVR